MICKKCGEDKEFDDFFVHTRLLGNKRGRKRLVCKTCQLALNCVMNATRRKEHRERLDKIKVNKGCVDCGFNRHSAALHFDHREPAKKRFVVAQSLLYAWKTILQEISKCDIRCANCHAIRTFESGQHLSRPR